MFGTLNSPQAGRVPTSGPAACLPPLDAPTCAKLVVRPACRRQDCGCLQCPVLNICSEVDRAEFFMPGDLQQAMRYKHKAVLFDQDEPADCLHVVVEGVVRLCRTLPDGRRQIVGFALPGELLGLAVDGRNAYSAEALGDVTTCRFSRRAFGELLGGVPGLLERLHAAVTHELNRAQTHMMLLAHYSARQKVAAFLLQMSERWRRVSGACVLVALPMPRQDIGDYLGLTMETVSRTISLLAHQKLIVVVPDGVRILDSGGLAKAAGE